MRRVLVLGLTIAALGGCAKEEEKSESFSSPLISPPAGEVLSELAMEAPAAAAAPAADATAAEGGSEPRNVPIPAGVAMLAYSYSYGLEAPPKQVRSLIATHEKACQDAGPAVCQVIASTTEENGEDRISGVLSMRAEPKWLARFRAGLGDQAKQAGGRLAKSSVLSEDLSRQIVDTEARLRAMTTLRDRLQALLASRPGKLQELLEVERELARVQGDIDSATSQLTMMRARVATSAIELEYTSSGVLAPEGVFAPIGSAFGDFLALIIGVFAFLIRAVAVLLPLILVGWGLWWLVRKPVAAIVRRRAKPAPPVSAPLEKKSRIKPPAP